MIDQQISPYVSALQQYHIWPQILINNLDQVPTEKDFPTKQMFHHGDDPELEDMFAWVLHKMT